MKKNIIEVMILALIVIGVSAYLYFQKSKTTSHDLENKLATVNNISPLPTSSQQATLQTSYKINNQELVITFKIIAYKPLNFDGADLVFTYPDNNLTALKIEAGKALDVCPRRSIVPGKIEISCINKLENNQSGVINQDLATVTFRINKTVSQPLVIDDSNTKIYYSGQSIPLNIASRQLFIK